MSRLARALDKAGEIATGAMEIGKDMLTVKSDEGYGVVTGKQRDWIADLEKERRSARREESSRRGGQRWSMGSGGHYVDPLLRQQPAWDQAHRGERRSSEGGGRRARGGDGGDSAPAAAAAAPPALGKASESLHEKPAATVHSAAGSIGSHIDEFGKGIGRHIDEFGK